MMFTPIYARWINSAGLGLQPLLQNRQQPTQVTRIKARLNNHAPATAMP